MFAYVQKIMHVQVVLPCHWVSNHGFGNGVTTGPEKFNVQHPVTGGVTTKMRSARPFRVSGAKFLGGSGSGNALEPL